MAWDSRFVGLAADFEADLHSRHEAMLRQAKVYFNDEGAAGNRIWNTKRPPQKNNPSFP